jgi:tyrosine-protein kinase
MVANQPMYPPIGDAVDLREYVRVLRKRIWVIVVGTLLCVGLAAAFVLTSTPIYRAHATVLLKPTGVNLSQVSAGWDKLISPDTEAAVVTSLPVAQAAGSTLKPAGDPSALLKNVSVSVSPDSQTLDIFYTSPDPKRAAALANAFAGAYLEYRRSRAEGDIKNQILSIQQDVRAQESKLRAYNEVISNDPTSAAAADARAQRDIVTAQLTVLQSNMLSLGLLNTDPGEIIYSAQAPRTPTSPKPKLDMALGLVVGLFLGIVLAFIRDRMDEHLKRPEDVEAVVGAPVLARIPPVKESRQASVVGSDGEEPAVSEAFRALRVTLLATTREANDKVILVVSSVEAEGKSTVATNLAVVLAQADKSVVLVSADLRRPADHRLLGASSPVGLTDVLAHEVELDHALQTTSVPGLTVLSGGRTSSRPTEVLESRAMRAALAQLSQRYDFVILDGAPILAVADSLVLAHLADAVLFVVDPTRATRSALTVVRTQLGHVGANIVGTVLNRVRSRDRAHVYYQAQYGNGNGNGSAKAKRAQRKSKVER